MSSKSGIEEAGLSQHKGDKCIKVTTLLQRSKEAEDAKDIHGR
jgi:hypothetical protein